MSIVHCSSAMVSPQDPAAKAELIAGLPFLELSLVSQSDFIVLVNEFFATDRNAIGKGMVEIARFQSRSAAEATRK